MSDPFDFEKVDRYAVMGNPVAHSKSPRIHALFAHQFKHKIDYTAIQVDAGGFPQAVDQFRAAMRESEADQEALRRDTRLAIRRAYFSILTNQQQIDLAVQVIKTATVEFQNQLLRYKHGQTTNTEVLDAQEALTKSEIAYAESLGGSYAARALLANHLGVRDIAAWERRAQQLDHIVDDWSNRNHASRRRLFAAERENLMYQVPRAATRLVDLRDAFPRAMAKLERGYPRVIALHERVAARPRIAAYLASPRRIPFNQQGIFRHYPELDPG